MIEGLPYFWGIALLCVVWSAAYKDIRSFTIPHLYPMLVVILWGVALPFALTGFLNTPDLIWNITSAGLAFFIGFILFALRLMGGGDVKLFTALSLWIKFSNLHIFVLFMVILGLFYTLLYAAWQYMKRRYHSDYKAETRMETYRIIKRSKVPYGPAIALGLTAYLAVLYAY